jgi:hypothetical protein
MQLSPICPKMLEKSVSHWLYSWNHRSICLFRLFVPSEGSGGVVMYLMRGQMAHERLTPEGHGANGIRVEKRVKEGLTVPVLCISYTCRPRIQCLNADLTWRSWSHAPTIANHSGVLFRDSSEPCVSLCSSPQCSTFVHAAHARRHLALTIESPLLIVQEATLSEASHMCRSSYC